MRATRQQARRNERNLSVLQTGYGHWEISCDYRGKRISCTTTDSVSIDNWRDRDNDRLNLLGYRSLCTEIICKNYPKY